MHTPPSYSVGRDSCAKSYKPRQRKLRPPLAKIALFRTGFRGRDDVYPPGSRVVGRAVPGTPLPAPTSGSVQNLVQFGLVRPRRRKGVCWFDASALLTANVVFYLKDWLGASTASLSRVVREVAKLPGFADGTAGASPSNCAGTPAAARERRFGLAEGAKASL